MFLIEKLPSEDQKPTTKAYPSNKKHQLFQEMSNKIAEDLNTIWIPVCCQPSVCTNLGDFVTKQGKLLIICRGARNKFKNSSGT